MGPVLKSVIRKSKVHRGRRYAFGGLITRLGQNAGVPEEGLDYMALLIIVSIDVTKTKGPDTINGPTLTTTERNRRDDLIMARMYGLETLLHKNGFLASTSEQLAEVERQYPFN